MVRHKASREQHTISVPSGKPPQGALSSPEGSLAWLGWPLSQGEEGQLGLQRAGVPVGDTPAVTSQSPASQSPVLAAWRKAMTLRPYREQPSAAACGG